METPNASQTSRILKYLLSGNKLTALQALKKFKCFRLASRINELRNMNRYKIIRERVTTKLSSKKIVRYSIQL